MSDERIEYLIEAPKGSSFSTTLSVSEDGSTVTTFDRGTERYNLTRRELKIDESDHKDIPPKAEGV